MLLRRLPNLRLAQDNLMARGPIFFARGFSELHLIWDADEGK